MPKIISKEVVAKEIYLHNCNLCESEDVSVGSRGYKSSEVMIGKCNSCGVEYVHSCSSPCTQELADNWNYYNDPVLVKARNIKSIEEHQKSIKELKVTNRKLTKMIEDSREDTYYIVSDYRRGERTVLDGGIPEDKALALFNERASLDCKTLDEALGIEHMIYELLDMKYISSEDSRESNSNES